MATASNLYRPMSNSDFNNTDFGITNPFLGATAPSNVYTDGGGAGELLLPIFEGNLIRAYNQMRMFTSLVKSHTITSGIHYDFIKTWKIGAEYHNAGEELQGLESDQAKIRISLDDRPRASHHYVDDIDEMLKQFDTTSEVSFQMGEALSNEVDRDVYRQLVLAARSGDAGGPPTLGDPFLTGGNDAFTDADRTLTTTTVGTYTTADAEDVLKALDKAEVYFNENDIPFTGRYCVVEPSLWGLIRDLPRIVAENAATNVPRPIPVAPMFSNNDVANGPNASLGYTASANMFTGNNTIVYKGFMIIMSNNIRKVNGKNLSTDGTNRAADYTKTAGVIFTTEAVAFLQKFGIVMETERKATRGQDFLVAKTMTGTGVLRPECAIELIADT